jgi:Na+/H+ antiporter NhaD/arsenite permease-like protein
VTEQDIATVLTALMALASYLWRLLSEQKLWTIERWFYLIVSWAVLTYSTIRLIERLPFLWHG